MSCKTCFEDWICKCLPYDSTITINSPLPLGNYVVVVTDHFQNKYSVAVSIYDQGSFEINIADFPDGFWSEHGGIKTIEVMESDGCTPIKIPMMSEYSCLEVTIVGGTMDKSTIGCELPSIIAAVGVFTEVFSSVFL